MARRGSGLFHDGALVVLFSKYAWYRKLGYPATEAAEKARWRAGAVPRSGAKRRSTPSEVPARPREAPVPHSR